MLICGKLRVSAYCGDIMKNLKARMNNLESRLIAVLEERREYLVTFTYDGDTQKTMSYHDAMMEVLGDYFHQPRITESDQPTGSFIWAMIIGDRQAEENDDQQEENDDV